MLGASLPPPDGDYDAAPHRPTLPPPASQPRCPRRRARTAGLPPPPSALAPTKLCRYTTARSARRSRKARRSAAAHAASSADPAPSALVPLSPARARVPSGSGARNPFSTSFTAHPISTNGQGKAHLPIRYALPKCYFRRWASAGSTAAPRRQSRARRCQARSRLRRARGQQVHILSPSRRSCDRARSASRACAYGFVRLDHWRAPHRALVAAHGCGRARRRIRRQSSAARRSRPRLNRPCSSVAFVATAVTSGARHTTVHVREQRHRRDVAAPEAAPEPFPRPDRASRPVQAQRAAQPERPSAPPRLTGSPPGRRASSERRLSRGAGVPLLPPLHALEPQHALARAGHSTLSLSACTLGSAGTRLRPRLDLLREYAYTSSILSGIGACA
jgi:hypothetical protein